MRNIIGILVVALLVSTTVNAQEKKQNNIKRTNFTSEQIATLQTKRMALNFDLDKNQQKAVYDLKKKQADERKNNIKNFRQKRQNNIKPTNDERFNFQNTRLEKQLENKVAMKNILTKDQFSKWEKFDKSQRRNGNNRLTNANNNRKKQPKNLKRN